MGNTSGWIKSRARNPPFNKLFCSDGSPTKNKNRQWASLYQQESEKVLSNVGVTRITGIPHSPTGQAIVERTNQTLKRYLRKFYDIKDIQERVSKTLFVMNYLCIFGDSEAPPVKCHSGASDNMKKQAMKVYYRDLSTGKWEGPAEVQFIGKGYMCVFTPSGPQWIPARWTKAAIDDASLSTPEHKQS